MPSILIGYGSGVQQLISGCFWSGTRDTPIGGIQLRLHPNASGNIYVGLSGGITLNSGNVFLSGGGLLDGVIMAPGDGYFIPKAALSTSGTISIYAHFDAACSGQSRLYWEAF